MCILDFYLDVVVDMAGYHSKSGAAEVAEADREADDREAVREAEASTPRSDREASTTRSEGARDASTTRSEGGAEDGSLAREFFPCCMPVSCVDLRN